MRRLRYSSAWADGARAARHVRTTGRRGSRSARRLSGCANVGKTPIRNGSLRIDDRGMTPRQQQALEIVRAHGPVSRGDVARRMRVSPATVEQHLAAVRRAGHIRVDNVGRFSRWRMATELELRQYQRPATCVWEWRGESAGCPA